MSLMINTAKTLCIVGMLFITIGAVQADTLEDNNQQYANDVLPSQSYVSSRQSKLLKGYAEQDDTSQRIQRPPDSPGSLINNAALATQPVSNTTSSDARMQGYANKRSSLIDVSAFAPLTPQYAAMPPQNVYGKADGGQNEYWINWDAWRHRIADAVWRPIIMQGIMMYGQTRVDYDVTRDHHVRITNIYTPDPSGVSGKILANAIMRLDGNPIFEFPSGSQQVVHHNWNKDLGLPFLSRLGQTIYLPGGIEHVVNRW